ncbi:MAG: sigma 54-interacting transcriptional regulator [Bdellovibrionota bacterium]
MNGSYALIGSSAIIRHVQHLVFKIAEGLSTVLITGEPGTGKEIIAKMIHDRSSRNSSPFIPAKCTNMTEELLEVELFGLETNDSSSRMGSFLQAENGTIYLDEVSKLSPKLQHALFRVLHENKICPVGGQTEIPVQARLICSTSVDLEQLVRRGHFREDLFYKLSVSSIYLPPLRERREDISILADFFVQKFNQLKSKKITGISHDAMNAMLQNSWNNNLQELENLIERIVVLKNTGSIEICDLPPKLRTLVTDNIDTFYDKQVEITNNQNYGQGFNQGNHSMNNMQNQNQHQNLHAGQNQNSNQNHNYTSYNKQNNVNHNMNSSQSMSNSQPSHFQRSNPPNNMNTMFSQNYHQSSQPPQLNRLSLLDDLPSEIDQFIKKEIDLGAGIDFYRVVEEFENRLISEALRRTNHNKNRAAQLLSMNRTTLVEKLKKRASSSSIKSEGSKVKRNSAFTIFDGLGAENNDFEGIDFLNVSGEEGI